MKTIPTLVVFAAAALTIPTYAGEEVDKTLSAEKDGIVEIVNTRGTVEIEGWGESEVRVQGELDDLTDEFVFEVEGDRTLIEVKLPKRNVNWGDGSDLDIRVPENSRVSFEGVSTDTTIIAVAGGIKIRTVSGDITASEINNQINVKTVSGDIDVRDSSGQANVSSVSGEIELDIDSSRLMLDTVSGDVEANLETFERLMANAVSGDIDVEGHFSEDGEIEISSVSSEISLELTAPINATISAQTGPGGDITNLVSDDEVETKFPAMNRLKTTVGDGSGSINLRTVSGDIRIDEGS